MGQNANEYPQASHLGANAVEVNLGADVLMNGINRALFATADDELRPVMNGIYFDITTEDLTFVASDGHKLVRNKSYKARGKRLTTYEIDEIIELEPTKFPPPPEVEEELETEEPANETAEQLSLFDSDSNNDNE
jgi:hypothetical protein